LEDETDRNYSLEILASLSEKRAVVPMLWFYEIGNGLLMAYRRKRISLDQIEGFLERLKALPIEAAEQTAADALALPGLAQRHGLTNYDAAYLAVAIKAALPLQVSTRISGKRPLRRGCKCCEWRHVARRLPKPFHHRGAENAEEGAADGRQKLLRFSRSLHRMKGLQRN